MTARTILFDLDGTLTDSYRGVTESFKFAMAAVGAPEPSAEVVRGVVGPPMLETFDLLGLGSTESAAAMAAYRQRYDRVGWLENAVFAGVEGLLTSLRDRGHTLAVATSKPEPVASRILHHFELAQHFSAICGGHDVTGSSKAHVVRRALESVGVPPILRADGGTPDVTMVGDRSHDVEGAGVYGIPTALVTWGYSLPEERDHAAWVVNDVEALEEVLTNDAPQ